MLLLAVVAIAPGVSIVAGLLLMIPAVQMIAGKPAPVFPRRIADRPFPTQQLAAVVRRAVPVLRRLETMVHPRWPIPSGATKRLVGAVVLVLDLALLLTPLPFSNIVPALVIALIALAYLEEDGLLLLIALLAAVDRAGDRVRVDLASGARRTMDRRPLVGHRGGYAAAPDALHGWHAAGTHPFVRRETCSRRPGAPSAGDAAGVVHAPGRTLSAGVSRTARQGRRLPRPVLHARMGDRSDLAADPALRLRCRDPVLRHSGRAARARPHSDVRSGRRTAARAARRCGEAQHARARRGRDRIRAGVRGGAAREGGAAAERRAARLLRRAVDGRDLHGGRTRHAGPGTRAHPRLSRARRVCPHDRYSGRRVVALSGRTIEGRRRRGADLRHLGRRAAAF